MRTIAARLILGGLFSAALASAANAQAYPSRPITMIIPFAGGSASDVVSAHHARPDVQVDGAADHRRQPPRRRRQHRHRCGDQAAPDGYTLLARRHRTDHGQQRALRDLGYDPDKDLEPISPFAHFTIVVVASSNLPVKSLERIDCLRQGRPGKLNYGSVGIGSSQHLSGVYFEQAAGIKLTHVPYRNIAQYGPDLIAGTVPLGFQWFPNVSAPIQAGGAKALASPATSGWRRCPMRRRRPRRACPTTRSPAGSRWRRRAARRVRSSSGSTRS